MFTSTVFWKALGSVSGTWQNCGIGGGAVDQNVEAAEIVADAREGVVLPSSPMWQAMAVALPPAAMIASATG